MGDNFPTLKAKVGLREMAESAEHPSTPPFQASGAVPFKWEEQPGKPRACSGSGITTRPEPKSLELPPGDKFTKTPSPTTILDGPYKFSSFRDSEGLLGGRKGRGFFGKFKREVDAGSSCRFSPSTVSTCDSSEDMFAPLNNNCGCALKINTNGSFSNISHPKPSQLWTSFCHGIKQVMHWKGGKKSNKEGRHSRSDM